LNDSLDNIGKLDRLSIASHRGQILLLSSSTPQQTEKEPTIPDIETEIECPRCYDIMALSSDFDRLYYFCEECNLSLNKLAELLDFINYAIIT
jgi:hypothetical protein